MFVNPSKNLVVPQRNHAHLAANIATYWGNTRFDLPVIPFQSILKGIAFHQNGYYLFDTNQVTQMSDDVLLQVLKDDFYLDCNDNDAELVCMFHQHRLISNVVNNTKEARYGKLKEEFEKVINKKLAQSQYTQKDFLWANRITHLCDKISFNFSMGKTIPENVEIYEKIDSSKTIVSTHQLQGDTIYLDPWPFSIDRITSTVIAYKQKGYPSELTSELMTLTIMRQQVR